MKKIISSVLVVLMIFSALAVFDITASADTSTGKIYSISNTSNGVTIKWTKKTDAVKYIIQKKTSEQKEYTDIYTTNSSTYSYTDKSVKAGTAYAYKIIAVNNYYTQYAYPAVSIVNLQAPKNVKATINKYGIVKISWKKSKGAKKYEIYRKSSGKFKKAGIEKGTSFYDYGAKSGAVNTYKIVAVNGSSKSVYSSKKKLTYITPPTPVGIATINGIKLVWNETSSGAKGYKIYKANSTSGKYSLLKKCSANTKKYVDKNVKEGKSYKYYIVSYKGSVVSSKEKLTVKYSPMLTVNVKVGESNTKFKDYMETSKELLTGLSGNQASELFDLMKFTYTVQNKKIASVDSDGTIHGISPGTTNIGVTLSMSLAGYGKQSESMGFIHVNVTK